MQRIIGSEPLSDTVQPCSSQISLNRSQSIWIHLASINLAAVASSQNSRKKDVLIGIHVTKEEQTELRQMFCSNGFSLATAYRAAMTYLRQDISDGKAIITNNGEILRK